MAEFEDVSVMPQLGDGLVEYQVIDGLDVVYYFTDTVICTDKGYLVDFDGDGVADEEIRPLGLDLNGDGVEDFGLVLSDNALETALDKPFSQYTVSEALLFVIGVYFLVRLVMFCWRRFKL